MLLTGASGFVGKALVTRLQSEDVVLHACYRHLPDSLPSGIKAIEMPDLGMQQLWTSALTGIELVVHAAARVHVMQEMAVDPLAEFRKTNVEATLALAREAAAAGARRFVFLSSVKVHGESTPEGCPFREEDSPAPQDAYGQSKYEAERGLREIADQTGMEVVIIRPPLVYGPGVRANFRLLLRAVMSGVPLPLGAIQNRRSMVGLGNLVDFIVVCLRHPKAANQTFLVSDGKDLSTPELIRGLAAAVKKPARLLPVPVGLLRGLARVLGRYTTMQRLCDSLQVDTFKARTLLNWCPQYSVEHELQQTVAGMR